MSGHNKWSQIKHQKGTTDAKRSQIFSKLGKIISLTAKKGENPDFNPELRAAIEKAKKENMPSDNIERAIKRGAGKLEGVQLESVCFEAYGPGGAAIIIEGITDNKNRTVAEIKHTLAKNNGKFVASGSVLWAFEHIDGKWTPKHTIELNENDTGALNKIFEELDNHDDIQNIYTNAL